MGTRRPVPPAKRPAGKHLPPLSDSREPADLLGQWVTSAQLGDEVRDTLVTWLARQFAADQYAKLEQGSHATGGVPLRKVFVDLPITAQPVIEDSPQQERRLFVKTLLSCKPVPFSPGGRQEPFEQSEPPRIRRRAPDDIQHGFILIGGPGQGKSTLGQLACQLHRTALLAPFLGQLTPSQQDMVRPFTQREAQADLGWPPSPLLPIGLILPQISAGLAQEGVLAGAGDGPLLLKLVALQAGLKGSKVSAEALGTLLRHAPVLLVLDGLDEVGATEDRVRLIAAVRELLGFLDRAGTRGLVVATTRPQGYTGELDRLGVNLETAYLAPLRPEEALAYGSRLAEAKLGSNPDRAEKVRQGLANAAKEPATARLLYTPLQVTILAALVERRGPVPKERWDLFLRYFDTIFDREVERGTYASPLLQDHRMSGCTRSQTWFWERMRWTRKPGRNWCGASLAQQKSGWSSWSSPSPAGSASRSVRSRSSWRPGHWPRMARR
jgi:hypothetical protein